ncbi:MAG: GGDEF domain-containing protein [Oscillospiraceae bacterium]|nr:GGDEF domain-containing protein [Oscillospiraceae bacterium]
MNRDVMNISAIIEELQRKLIGGILITDENGEEVFRDANVTVNRHFLEHMTEACPAGEAEGTALSWEYWDETGEKCFQVITATGRVEGVLYQVHQFVDISDSFSLYRAINDYSTDLEKTSEHDRMTGLYNKGKYMELIRVFYPKQESVAVFNMDVNNLKKMNDSLGHEMGDKLLIKAASSIQAVTSDSVAGFRLGGDEFMMIAHDITEQDALDLKSRWEEALSDLNEKDKEIDCIIACGLAYGKGSDLEELLRLADERMYSDKKKKKKPGEEIR